MTKRIVLGIPTLNGIQPEFFDSWNNAFMYFVNNKDVSEITTCVTEFDGLEKIIKEKKSTIKIKENPIDDYKVFLHTVPRTQNHHARNLIMEKAVEFDSDYCIMVDDDMVLNTNSFVHLVEMMEANKDNIDVLALLAFKRGEPYTPVGYVMQNNVLNVITIDENTKDAVEVDAVGFGCVIIKTSLLEKMTPPYCLVDELYRGSDMYFCHRAKCEMGAKIFIDCGHEIGHIGQGHIATRKDYLK